MRVSDEYRLLFVHVQKTGGNTVRGLLNGALPDPRNPLGELPKHAHLGGILKAEPGLAAYYVFGFVRNPWSRLVSWWSMIQDAKVNAEAGNEGAIERLRTNRFMRVVATSYDTFDEFVLRGPDDLPNWARPSSATWRRRNGAPTSWAAPRASWPMSPPSSRTSDCPRSRRCPEPTPARRGGPTRTSTPTRPDAGWPTSTPRTSRRSATPSDPIG